MFAAGRRAGRAGAGCFVILTLPGPGTRGGGKEKKALSFPTNGKRGVTSRAHFFRGSFLGGSRALVVQLLWGDLSQQFCGPTIVFASISACIGAERPSWVGRRRRQRFATGGFHSGNSGRREEVSLCALLSVYS